MTPAGIAQDVGDELDVPALLDDPVRLVGRRPVGGLGEQAALEPRRVLLRDDPLQRRGDEDGALELEELLVRDGLAAVEVLEDAGIPDVGERLLHVDPGRVVDPAGVVGDRDDLARPSRRGRRAVSLPTLPKPWIATVALSTGIFMSSRYFPTR